MALSAEIITDFTVQVHPVQWPKVYNQICRSGPQRINKFASVARCISPQWPLVWKDHKSRISRQILIYIQNCFRSQFSGGDQLGTFGGITLDNKISLYCPFSSTLVLDIYIL
jgi:hypothetical protein